MVYRGSSITAEGKFYHIQVGTEWYHLVTFWLFAVEQLVVLQLVVTRLQ